MQRQRSKKKKKIDISFSISLFFMSPCIECRKNLMGDMLAKPKFSDSCWSCSPTTSLPSFLLAWQAAMCQVTLNPESDWSNRKLPAVLHSRSLNTWSEKSRQFPRYRLILSKSGKKTTTKKVHRCIAEFKSTCRLGCFKSLEPLWKTSGIMTQIAT